MYKSTCLIVATQIKTDNKRYKKLLLKNNINISPNVVLRFGEIIHILLALNIVNLKFMVN